MNDATKTRGLRSRAGEGSGAGSVQAVGAMTANAGPDGPPLKSKYLRHTTKKTKSKTSGNSGGVGRRAIAAKRGHGGGQETFEQRQAREAQSASHQVNQVPVVKH